MWTPCANLGATVHYTREGQDGEQSVWGEIALVAIPGA